VILEWRHPLPVETPHGEGIALLYIDRGADLNPEYHVRLRGGHVKNYYSPDIRLVGNPMDGHGWDVDLPADWKSGGEESAGVKNPARRARGLWNWLWNLSKP